MEQLAARLDHNQQVAGSSPAPATTFMNATATVTRPEVPRLTPETLAACFRQGCYVCGHCSRLSRIGEYFEPEENQPCPHCKKHGVLRWLPPVLDEGRN